MISNATINDLSTINKLGLVLYDNFINIYHVENYISNDCYQVLTYNDDITKGFLIAYNNIDYIELLVIIVDPNYRRLNIGFKLMNYLIDNNDKDILLEVASKNESAIRLYEKCGFKKIGIREKYYKNLDDAYIMKLVRNEK